MIRHGDYRESRLDQAISRGFDPTDPDVITPRPPLSPEWQAALDASVAEVAAIRERAAADSTAEVA